MPPATTPFTTTKSSAAAAAAAAAANAAIHAAVTGGADHRSGNSNRIRIDHKNTNNHNNRATSSRLYPIDSDMPDPNSSAPTRPSSSSSSAIAPIKIDGSEEDAVLARSKFLHRREVLRRRSRRLRQLSSIYRDQYWSLMEDLKLKYREYYWEYGKSPFVEDNEENAGGGGGALGNGENNNNNNNNNQVHNNGNNDCNRCGVHGCKTKAMALTRFCHMHILSDGKQKLYKACDYAIKSSPTGPILCGKPILRSTVPPYCTLHFQKAEKHMTRALKKAGYNVSSTSKPAPKLHDLVCNFVNQIKNIRRDGKKSMLQNSKVKEENRS